MDGFKSPCERFGRLPLFKIRWKDIYKMDHSKIKIEPISLKQKILNLKGYREMDAEFVGNFLWVDVVTSSIEKLYTHVAPTLAIMGMLEV